MRLFRSLFLSMTLILAGAGFLSAEGFKNPDQEEAKLQGLSRAELLAAVGTPLKEVTDPTFTLGFFDSVIFVSNKDVGPGTLHLYFLKGDKTTAYANLNYYKKGEVIQLMMDRHELGEEYSKKGFRPKTEAEEAPKGKPNATFLYNSDSQEFFFMDEDQLNNGEKVFQRLYSKDAAVLKNVLAVMEKLDNTILLEIKP